MNIKDRVIWLGLFLLVIIAEICYNDMGGEKMGEVVKLRDNKLLIPAAAEWFSECWGIPQYVYADSMASMSAEKAVPQWYVYTEDGRIVGGAGVIENDFHDRKDLSPNVCAVFVDEKFRRQGIAGKILNTVCDDMHVLGVDTLYLITDHDGFYERYGWTHLTYANEDGGGTAKVYIHIFE